MVSVALALALALALAPIALALGIVLLTKILDFCIYWVVVCYTWCINCSAPIRSFLGATAIDEGEFCCPCEISNGGHVRTHTIR